MAPGTARKLASIKSVSVQPENLEGTLSHQAPSPGPLEMRTLGLSRKESSTAFLSHWLTVHWPDASRWATRCWPESSAARAASTASRTAPVVEGEREARSSHAASMVVASCFTSVTLSLRPGLTRSYMVRACEPI